MISIATHPEHSYRSSNQKFEDIIFVSSTSCYCRHHFSIFIGPSLDKTRHHYLSFFFLVFRIWVLSNRICLLWDTTHNPEFKKEEGTAFTLDSLDNRMLDRGRNHYLSKNCKNNLPYVFLFGNRPDNRMLLHESYVVFGNRLGNCMLLHEYHDNYHKNRIGCVHSRQQPILRWMM